jgi:hypothetical protein
MNDKQFQELKEEVTAIKKLLVLGLQKSGVQGGAIATALGISQGRLSQIAATKKYKKHRDQDASQGQN